MKHIDQGTRSLADPGDGPRGHVRGASLQGLLFWIVGIAIFGAPFLRSPDGTTWIGEDHRRSEDDIPFDEDVGYFEEDYELELSDLIEEGSEAWFGLESEAFLARGLVELERIEPGREMYALHCAGCHGDEGDGAGPAARHLSPRPRNFRKGTFKFTSTPTFQKPLRRDIFETITRGLAGSAMPGFRLVSEERRWDLVEYVRYVAMRGDFENLMLDDAWDLEELPDAEENAEIIYERWDPEEQRAVYPTVAETDRDEASIERGREIFLDANRTQCDTCHGTSGKGDGVSAQNYNDDWGYKLVPRDFTAGVFRVGDSPEALWRSIATGINGTPMGAFDGNLSGEEIWDLVHFVQALAEGTTE